MKSQIFNAPNYLIWFAVWLREEDSELTTLAIGQAVDRRYLAKTVIDCYKELQRKYPTETHAVMFLHVSDDANQVDATLQHELLEEIGDLL